MWLQQLVCGGGKSRRLVTVLVEKKARFQNELKPWLGHCNHVFAIIVAFRIAGLCQVLSDLGTLAGASLRFANKHRIFLDGIQNLVFVLGKDDLVVLIEQIKRKI